MKLVLVLALFVANSLAQYQPNWDSLDSRPIPGWFDEAKVGIFLHWGVYSVPSYGDEWFWERWKEGESQAVIDYINNNFKPGFSYQDFARDFTAEFFDPNQWAELFRNSGARYVILTGKHHEGYTLWPSTYSYSWNANDVGPHRDLLGDVGSAVKNAGLRFGVYHSLAEWYNPDYRLDQANNYQTSHYVDSKVLPELYEVVNNYQPDILWSDGDWAQSDYWRAPEFLAWLYNESPVRETIITNDRWGYDTTCTHGDFWNCADHFNPGTLQPHKWENALTLDKNSWGYRRNTNIGDVLTPHEVIVQVASTISCNGNVLINVGPTKEGHIAPIYQERLLSLGNWLSTNSEAIYGSRPWTAQNDTLAGNDVWYTTNGNNVYAIFLSWPDDNTLVLGSVRDLFNNNISQVVVLQNANQNLQWEVDDNSVRVHLPDYRSVDNDSQAWVLRIRVG